MLTTGQLITIVIAIFGSSGLWHLLETRLIRKDELKDRDVKDLHDYEEHLELCSKSCKKLLAYILIPWQEDAMARSEKFVGIHEYEVMSGLCETYRELGGNGTVKKRQDYIDTFDRVPDVDIERETEQWTN